MVDIQYHFHEVVERSDLLDYVRYVHFLIDPLYAQLVVHHCPSAPSFSEVVVGHDILAANDRLDNVHRCEVKLGSFFLNHLPHSACLLTITEHHRLIR